MVLTPKKGTMRNIYRSRLIGNNSRNTCFYLKSTWGQSETVTQNQTLTLFLSTHCVAMTITCVFCSHIILQKSSVVPGRGPCVAMYARGCLCPCSKDSNAHIKMYTYTYNKDINISYIQYSYSYTYKYIYIFIAYTCLYKSTVYKSTVMHINIYTHLYRCEYIYIYLYIYTFI